MKCGKYLLPAAVLACACAVASLLSVAIVFPDQEARTLTVSVEITAIEPGAGASCQALLQQSAQPGDEGYAIEDQLEVAYPEGTGARPLADIGPGRRLFYALALDQEESPILHGCTDVEKTGRGAAEVTIELEWRCRPSNGGVETCDNLDNDCNGTVDDGNPVFLCPQVHRAVATACTAGLCQYQCESGWYDANQSWSDGCECHPTRGGVEWCDDLDNDCDGVTDGANCLNCSSAADCADPDGCLESACSEGKCSSNPLPDGRPCPDDGNLCSSDDCRSGLCLHESLPDTTLCDDGLFCTVNDACRSGACAGEPRDCGPPASPCQEARCREELDSCETSPLPDGTTCPGDGVFCDGEERCQGGWCLSSGDPCPGPDGDGDCVESCNEAAGDCGAPDAAGSLCDDGIGCTRDACDGAGTCNSAPDHGACAGGGFCLPACAGDESGCLYVNSLQVNCPDTAGDAVDCLVTTDPPLSRLAACLACEANLVEPILAFADFESNAAPGSCDLEGWQATPVLPPLCSTRGQTCPLGQSAFCCANPICPTAFAPFDGRLALEFDDRHCGTGESMRLWSAFDLRAFERAEFCLDVGHYGGGLGYKVFQLWQDPPGAAVFCQAADSAPLLPSEGLGRLCAPLAPFFSSPSTRLDVWLQAGTYGWVVDNFWLQAGYESCTPTTREVFREDFTGCPPVLPGGSWNGWTLNASGNSLRCENSGCLDPGLRLENGTFSLERRVDASALASGVWLCWEAAGVDTYRGTVDFRVEFDAGSGWQTAYETFGPAVAGQPDTCQRNCVDLYALSPGAARNPSLGIRFSVAANANGLLLDDIVVQGPDTCAPGSRVQLGQIDERGAGLYGISVVNLSGHNLPVRLECSLSSSGAVADEIFTFQVE